MTTPTTEAHSSLLSLMWLASPALPIGAFSYSEVLEAAVEQGLVHNEDTARQWLGDQLHLTQARGDMALIAQAIQAWRLNDQARLQQLSQWVFMTRESAELRLQCEQMGRSLLDWLRNLQLACDEQLQLCTQLQPSYPMVMALALHLSAAPLSDAVQAYAFGWAENMCQAAVKLVPLGQSAGQRVLGSLVADIPQVAALAIALPDSQRQVFTPQLAILSARHEHQYSRLFRS